MNVSDLPTLMMTVLQYAILSYFLVVALITAIFSYLGVRSISQYNS